VVTTGGVRSYFIHYNGWKDKWDKWVSASELLKVSQGEYPAG